MRGPFPSGSTIADAECHCSSGMPWARRKPSRVPKPSGGGWTMYPSASAQKWAWRSGSAASKTIWIEVARCLSPLGCQSGARRELLDGPAVAVRIGEEDEATPREVLDLTGLDAAAAQLATRRLDVLHHELEALLRTRLHVGQALPDGNRARRARGRQLHEPQ